MILKDWASNFVLGEFPSISRCPNMRKHPPTHPKRPPDGGQQKHTFPESSPHGHPQNGEPAARASQKRTSPPPHTNSSQAMAIGIPTHHDTPK